MEEEKGGMLHIIYIFIGLCLLCLGVFYYFTDDSYREVLNKQKTNNEDKDIIKQISLMNNIETSLTLKNKKELKIKYSVDEDTHVGTFYYDRDLLFKTSNELEQCDQFYLYNNSIISYCSSISIGELYIINSNGIYSSISSFDDKNYKMIPDSIKLKDGKLIVSAMRQLDENIEDLCMDTNNIELDSPVYSNYELEIKNDKVEFIFINTTKTLKEFINESCKIVE